MQQFTFQIFAQTATEQRLRLLDEQGKLRDERSLPQADIERFVAEVEKDYRSSKLDLSRLGRRLYEWLDGPTERWLAELRKQHSDLALHVDVESRLRHLPWELLYSDGYLCGHAHHRFTPIRQVNDRRYSDASIQRANRPLRVLFMAASPENVSPVLDFETEEGRILEATRHRPLELVVEESGSLEGLQEQVTAVDAGYFDVFHLTGHADTRTGKPVFILENPLGFKHEASADELACRV
jgi:hypothetical protein